MIVLNLLLIVSFFNFPVFAAELQIIGGETGLKVIASDTFFNELNIYPGDTIEGKVTIKNTNNTPFELFLTANRIDTQPPLGETDLYKQLVLTVILRNETIYSGHMCDFADEDGISLGVFNAGQTETMKISVYLPGEETGNEYQNIKHSNQWVFKAVSQESDLPKTGINSNIGVLTVVGIILIAVGALGIYKYKRSV
jgi:LPXTG-motif cell wall-anchored protein